MRQAQKNPRRRTLPNTEAMAPSQVLLRAESRGQLVAAEGAADVERRGVAGPDHAEQEDHQRGAVVLIAQRGERKQREPDVDQAEHGGRGIGEDARSMGLVKVQKTSSSKHKMPRMDAV